MQLAFYKGTKRVFNKLVVWKTEGPYSHCEAVFPQPDGSTLCASASFTDGGVRFKTIKLDPALWDIIDVPVSTAKCLVWFKVHEGERYDTRGLVNFIIPVGHDPNGWFCDEALGAAIGITHPERFDPTDLACICERIGGVWVGTDIALHADGSVAAQGT